MHEGTHSHHSEGPQPISDAGLLVVYRKEVKFHTLSFYDRLIWTWKHIMVQYLSSKMYIL